MIRCIYIEGAPKFPAIDQHPDAARYTIRSDHLGRDVLVDATGGAPTTQEVDAVINPRASQLAAIESTRDAALLAGVSWNNKDWHIDQTFQDHLTGLVAAFAAGILPANATVPIRTRANTVENLTYTELKQLAGVVLQRVQQIWADSWAAKDALS
jgi:hypothetical protein